MRSFVARKVAVEEQFDANTFLVGLAEDDSGEGQHLILQRAPSFSEQDRRLGMATYCTVTQSGTAYGGIVTCVLKGRTLEIKLNPNAAGQLGTTSFKIELGIDEPAVRRLRDGLQRVFPKDDRPAQFEV